MAVVEFRSVRGVHYCHVIIRINKYNVMFAGLLHYLGLSNYLNGSLNCTVCIRRVANCPSLSQLSCDSMLLGFHRPVESIFVILMEIVTRKVMLDF